MSDGVYGGVLYQGAASLSPVPSTSPLAGLPGKVQRKLVDAFIEVYAILISEMRLFGTAHQSASGPNQYSDHELFGDLYEAAQAEIEGAIEHVTAYIGTGFAMSQQVSSMALMWFERWRLASGGDWPRASLLAEQDLRKTIGQAFTVLRDSGTAVAGVESWLQGLIESHDLVLFHLQQRSA